MAAPDEVNRAPLIFQPTGILPFLRQQDPLPSFTPARIAQSSGEVLVRPTSAMGRIAQASGEVLLRPTSAFGRTAQSSAEVLLKPANPPARFSQVYLEVLQRNNQETYAIVWVD